MEHTLCVLCYMHMYFYMDRYDEVFVLQTFNASGDILTFIGKEDKAQFLGPGNICMYTYYTTYTSPYARGGGSGGSNEPPHRPKRSAQD